MPIPEYAGIPEVAEYDGKQWWVVFSDGATEVITIAQAIALAGEEAVRAQMADEAEGGADGGMTAEEAVRATGAYPANAPWPILDFADPDDWHYETDPKTKKLRKVVGDPVPGSGLARMLEWIDFAKKSGFPIGPQEAPPSARYASYKDALIAAPEGWEPTVQGGSWTLKQSETPTQPGGLVTIAGETFIQQPNRTLTPYTPPREQAAPLLSLDEQIDQFILSGRVDEAKRLWDAEQQVRGGGRLTRQQAAQMVFGAFDDIGDVTPQQFKAWIDALAGPEAPQGMAPAPPVSPSARSFGEFARAMSVDAQGNALQFRDVQGNPVANPFAAELANRPFPAFPQESGLPGMAPEPPGAPLGPTASPDAVLAAFQQQGAPLAQGFNPQAQAEAEAEGLQGPQPVFQAGTQQTQTPFAAASAAQGGAGRQGVFQVPQGMNPFDAAVWLSQTAQASATGNPLMDALRRKEAELRGTQPGGQPIVTLESMAAGNAAMGGSATPGPAGQQPGQRPSQQSVEQGLKVRTWPQAVQDALAGQTPENQRGILSGERTGFGQSGPEGEWNISGGELFQAPVPSEPVVTPQQQVLNPFEQALFDIRRQQQVQRRQQKFQRTAVPTAVFR